MTPPTPHPVRRRTVRPDPCPEARRDAPPTSALNCVGLITGIDAEGFNVTSGGLRARGQRALSCLLEPALGDTVACLLVAPDEVWVIAVLQREEGVANVLQCRGDTRLAIEGGSLTLSAPALALETVTFNLKADKATVCAEEADLMGRNLRVVGTAVKLVGSVLATVFDRVTHFSRSHIRTTEGIDRVQATHVECEAQQLLRLSGEHALINGEKLIKARGGQIHFG